MHQEHSALGFTLAECSSFHKIDVKEAFTHHEKKSSIIRID